MKGSVTEYTANMDITQLPDYGIIVYALFGLVITAIMQSSSASIAIVLTALHANVIDFEAAAAIIIGANVGTTATILMGGIGATQMKKRVAFSHLIFNLITAIIGLALIVPLTILVVKLVGDKDAVIGIALFHTFFNVIGVVLFFPFIGVFSKLLLKLFPDRKLKLTHHLHKLTTEVSDAAVTGIQKEVVHLINNTLKFNLLVLGIDQKLVFTQRSKRSTKLKFEEQYENLKLLQAEIFTFSARLQSGELEVEDSNNLNRYLHAARMAMHSAKSMKDIKHNFVAFSNEDNEYIYNQNLDFKKRLIQLYLRVIELFDEDEHEDIAGVMAKLLKQMNKEDKEFVQSVQKVAANQSIDDIHVSEMLMINRVFIQSSKQVLAAIREVLLTEHEIAMFDSLTESDIVY